jgi:hypothetical protein
MRSSLAIVATTFVALSLATLPAGAQTPIQVLASFRQNPLGVVRPRDAQTNRR